VRELFISLTKQTDFFDELIIIDDASRDESVEIIRDYLTEQPVLANKTRFIAHTCAQGLAKTYNEGFELAKNELVIVIHQDVILLENCLHELLRPFVEPTFCNIVATTHIVLHPKDVWSNYPFWGKVYFSRYVGKAFTGIDGKCDCFKRSVIKKLGGFDETHFRTAGEDGDVVFRLKKVGCIANTQAKIIHIHNITPAFGFLDIIHKQCQYSEAQGALLRLGRITGLKNVIRSFFREILVLSLFVPYLNVLALCAIIFYSFWYSKGMFLERYKDKRRYLLPLLNIYLLFVSIFYSFKGFAYGRQKI